ncbi:MAG TPA: PH domain-containing protein [Aquihabitans sp.]|nr:PH domain-containing protein [Aquihabitans sp.]
MSGPPAAAPGAFDDREPVAHLSPRVMVLWRLTAAAFALVLLALAALVGAVATDLPDAARIALPLLVAVVGVVAVVALPAAAYRRWRYQLTEDGIELRHGLLVHQESSIPHFRVQHVDIRQGLLQRALGIVSLTISTASSATDASLPGVTPEVAEAIRHRVLDRAEADDGV